MQVEMDGLKYQQIYQDLQIIGLVIVVKQLVMGEDV